MSLLIVFGSWGVVAEQAFGQDRHWTNTTGSGNAFNNNSNWAEGSFPTSSENARFLQSGTYDVNFSADAASNQLFVENGFVTMQGNFLYTLSGQANIGNGATLQMNGTSATSSDYWYIGQTTNGTVNLDLGSSMTNYTSYLGYDTGTTGNTNITGGSSWNSNYFYAGIYGNGHLAIDGGGQLDVTSSSYIGTYADSVSTASVDGSGSIWNAGFLSVGYYGSGTVNVSNAGTLNSSGGRIGYYDIIGDSTYNGHGTMVIDGAGSTWNDSGSLQIGYYGTADVSANNGGVLNFADASIGYYSTDPGVLATVNIDGAGSQMNVSNNLAFGSGFGNLNVMNGGLVQVANTMSVGQNSAINLYSGNLNLTATPSATIGLNTTTLQMDGGVFNAMNDTIVAADGILNLHGGELITQNFSHTAGGVFDHNGGTLTVNGGSFDIGTPAGYVLDATSGTTGLQFQNGIVYDFNGDLTVGDAGGGLFGLYSGSQATNSNAFIAHQAGSNGTVIVDGLGSVWNNSYLYAGDEGNGTLNISNGGMVNNYSSYVGLDTGSVGIVNLFGAGSRMVDTSATYIGYNGNGTINVSDNAIYDTSYAYVGYSGTGQLNITNGGQFNAGPNYGVYVGYGGPGTVLVDGLGSQLNVEEFYLYSSGGETTVANSGVINVNGIAEVRNGSTLHVNTGSLNLSQSNPVASGLNAHSLNVYGNVNSTGTTFIDSDGTLTLSNGTLTTHSFDHTSGGTFDFQQGTLNIVGGTFDPGTTAYNLETIYSNVALNLNDGGNATFVDGFTIGSNGSLGLNGGWLQAGSISNTDGGTFTLNGGTVSVAGDVDNSGSSFVLSEGTLELDNGHLETGQSSFAIDSISGTSNILLKNGSTMNYHDSLTVGQNGTIDVESGNIDISDSANPSTGFSAGSLTINGGSTTADGSLSVGENGTGTVDINGGQLVVTGQMSIHAGGTVNHHAGLLQFGQTSFSEFQSINALAGTEIAGNINMMPGGIVDVSELDNISGTLLSYTPNVQWNNGGTILGSGSVQGSLNNLLDGELRVVGGDRVRFSTYNTTHTNSGRIDVIGLSTSVAELEFEAEILNDTGGLITARNALMRFDRGLVNEGQFSVALGDADLYGNILNDGGTFGIGGNSQVSLLGDIEQFGSLNILGGSKLIVFDDYFGYGYNGTGELEILGTLDVGSSPGVAEFGGDVTLGSSTLIELGGEEFGEFDKLIVRGDLFLNGQLDVEMWDDFELSHGNFFLIAEVDGQQSGSFWGLAEGDVVGNYNGHDLMISYGAGDGNDVALFTAVPEPSTNIICFAFLALACFAGRRMRMKLEKEGRLK